MSCSGGGCVVVDAAEDGTVYLSSDRRPEEPPTAIDADEWAAFLADVKAGKYDGDEVEHRRYEPENAGDYWCAGCQGKWPCAATEDELSNPDPSRRLTLDESQTLIKESYSDAIEELGRT